MNMMTRFKEYAAFTKNEQKMFLLLAVVFLAGAGVKLYNAYVIPPSTKDFDYTASDSEFTKRSAHLSSVQTANAAMNSAKPGKTTLPVHRINLNTASQEELDKLPGVGKGTAEQIVAYRTRHGKFTTVDELKNIKGIGERKFKTLQQFVSIQ